MILLQRKTEKLLRKVDRVGGVRVGEPESPSEMKWAQHWLRVMVISHSTRTSASK